MNINYYLSFDEPVPYKNLLIHPVSMKNYLIFMFMASVLTIEKDDIPDAQIIKMSYLEYLVRYNTEKNQYLQYLGAVIGIVSDNWKATMSVFQEKDSFFFKINDDVYDSEDFDNIRRIIIEQNVIEVPDSHIQKELRDSLEEARKSKMKMSDVKVAPLEDQMVALMIATGLTLDYIYTLPVRKFFKALERVDAKLHYEIYLAASMSGLVKFKDSSFIKHWRTEIKKDLYEDVKVDFDAMQDKISFGGKMK